MQLANKVTGSIPEKVKDYNEVNQEGCHPFANHKRTVAATHEAGMEKLGDRLKGLRYQQWRLKQMILDLDTKQKKKKGC